MTKQYLDVDGARYLVQKVKNVINSKTYEFNKLSNNEKVLFLANAFKMISYKN